MYHGGAVLPNSIYKTYSQNRLREIIIRHVITYDVESYSVCRAQMDEFVTLDIL